MGADWEPFCSLEHLRLRARVLKKIRAFFSAKGVMEVETPLLCQGIGSDPNLAFFSTQYSAPPLNQALFLQTSPEFAMKRLLAAGSGSIFQVCKAFRNGESGRFHNPEFTLLEWYRVGFDLFQLMDEIDELLQALMAPHLDLQATQRMSYGDIFYQATGCDPLAFSVTDYSTCARNNNLPEAVDICATDHALWLDFLFSHLVQPELGRLGLCMVYDYPASLPSLARLKPENDQLTERVEVFCHGVELGNGYNELIGAEEQQQRFDKEIQQRKQKGLPEVRKDPRLLAALTSGLPDCSGMAIGLDRLLMLMSGSARINEVLSFPIAKA